MADTAMNREQVLDELEFLSTVEHALVVEYLSVSCALGHDLEAGEGGATSEGGSAAAAAASSLAQSEMFHLLRLNRVLVDAGRSPQLGRALSIPGGSGAEVSLAPPGGAELEMLLDREHGIAAAVDARYTRLQPAVTSAPVFEGDLLDALRGLIVDDGPTHAAALTTLREALGGLAPEDFLRATRRDPADAFEQRLLAVSDRIYGLLLSALQERFAQPDFFLAGTFRDYAVRTMFALDDVNRALVQRGLLPALTLP